MMGVSTVVNGILHMASRIWSRFWASDAVALVLAGVMIGFVFALILFTITRWRKSSSGHLEVENAQEVQSEFGGPFGGALFPCA